ncbi:MAG: carbon monoxide dehydrogenase, partial [Ardenticatenales bacterium]|nr:carbon monoxide dehydrogenase [Ardenticatenales bacterium]
MKIEGRYIFHVPIEDVYEALRDEALLRQALPGHVYFKMTSPTEY